MIMMPKLVKTFVLLILIAAFACSESVPPVYNYLALGVSYTIGESVEEAERWPEQLSKALNNKGINLGTPKIIARTGWRTDQLLDSIQSDPSTKTNYELVSLLIGDNNQFQRRSVESFAPEFEE